MSVQPLQRQHRPHRKRRHRLLGKTRAFDPDLPRQDLTATLHQAVESRRQPVDHGRIGIVLPEIGRKILLQRRQQRPVSSSSFSPAIRRPTRSWVTPRSRMMSSTVRFCPSSVLRRAAASAAAWTPREEGLDLLLARGFGRRLRLIDGPARPSPAARERGSRTSPCRKLEDVAGRTRTGVDLRGGGPVLGSRRMPLGHPFQLPRAFLVVRVTKPCPALSVPTLGRLSTFARFRPVVPKLSVLVPPPISSPLTSGVFTTRFGLARFFAPMPLKSDIGLPPRSDADQRERDVIAADRLTRSVGDPCRPSQGHGEILGGRGETVENGEDRRAR